RRRNSKTNKAYLALFVCLSVKAVHLEIVSDISTEAFLAAFDRFTDRRGIPCEIHSDCGTNYMGAAKELKALFKEKATQETLNSRTECQWKFNPPAAPTLEEFGRQQSRSNVNHGGVDDACHPDRGHIEFTTTFIMYYSDPNDVCSLIPGHFLIGQPLAAIPSRNVVDVPMNLLNRWQLIQQAQQFFGSGGLDWGLSNHQFTVTTSDVMATRQSHSCSSRSRQYCARCDSKNG
ncbi:Integrase catalytic domain-containing protein, partial [Aphis craccivora]